MGSCAKNCTTNEVVPEFKCSHAEANTAMFTIYIVCSAPTAT